MIETEKERQREMLFNHVQGPRIAAGPGPTPAHGSQLGRSRRRPRPMRAFGPTVEEACLHALPKESKETMIITTHNKTRTIKTNKMSACTSREYVV